VECVEYVVFAATRDGCPSDIGARANPEKYQSVLCRVYAIMAMNVECVEFVVMAATEWERIWLWEIGARSSSYCGSSSG
jgi:hypothetical protein